MLIRSGLALAAAVTLSGAWLVAPKSAALSAEDLIAIQSLYTQYNWTLDTGDADAWAATFNPDGGFTIADQGAAGIHAGREALLKFATGFHATLGAHVKHWNTNLLITPTPGGADLLGRTREDQAGLAVHQADGHGRRRADQALISCVGRDRTSPLADAKPPWPFPRPPARDDGGVRTPTRRGADHPDLHLW